MVVSGTVRDVQAEEPGLGRDTKMASRCLKDTFPLARIQRALGSEDLKSNVFVIV